MSYIPDRAPLEEYYALRDAPLPELPDLLKERAAILWSIAASLPPTERRPCRQLASRLAHRAGQPGQPPAICEPHIIQALWWKLQQALIREALA